MSLNDRIREARKEKGITQEQLGKLIGVAKTTIAGYEKNREPSAAKVGEIADVLGVDVNYLFQDEIKRTPDYEESEAKILDANELKLIKDFRMLNNEGQKVATEAVDALTYAPKYKKSDTCKELA